MSDGFWSIVTIAALAGWIGSAIAFIFRAFPGRGRFEGRGALPWGIAFLILYCAWIVGLLNA